MPSLEHEALVDLFRERPELIPRLLADALPPPAPAHARCTVADPSLGQLVPTALRADLVVELCDAAGVPQLAAILEVQLRPEPDKLEVWPSYLTTYRERRHCDTCILVVTPSRDVAA